MQAVAGGDSAKPRPLRSASKVAGPRAAGTGSGGPWPTPSHMALLAAPRATLIDLTRLYADQEFRAPLIAGIRDPISARFWQQEYPQYDDRYRAEAAAPILNKAGQFAASPALRGILGQVSPKFDLTYAMNHRRILIANLAKGQIGEQAANLLGSLLVSHLQLAATGRSALAPDKRVPFFAHVDEFQSFGTSAFASLLSEARKFAAHFCLANQYVDQLSPSVRAAVLGNAGALIVFRVSGADAELLAPEFSPLAPTELVDQPPHHAWLRRAIGHTHVELLPPIYEPAGRLGHIRKQSRRNFGRSREAIEHSFVN